MTAPATTSAETRLPPGVTILSAQRLNGAYIIRHWLNNRTVYVCGQPEQHVRAGYWRRDGRMEGNGQGWICTVCHTLECGLYGTADRR